jgi:hypothetical protein
MPISINGTGTITGISAGGLPDACVTAADLASGAARSNFGAGCILQVAQGIETSVQNSLNSSTFADIPNITATITPTSTSSKILVMVSLYGGSTSNCGVRLMRGTTPIAVNTNSPSGSRRVGSAGDFYANASNTGCTISITFLDSPATTSATTYKMQYITTAGYPLCLNSNYSDADAAYVCRGVSTITLMEIAG